MTLYRTTMPSPLGELTLLADDDGLRAILLPTERAGRVATDEDLVDSPHPVLEATAEQLGQYFSGRRTDFDLPLNPRGTDFQRAVWTALLDISSGTTTSYGDVAAAIGRPTAARAIGAAVGRNPISIVVPCHRVVGVNGDLTGFAGGLEAKRQLLDLESGQLRVC